MLHCCLGEVLFYFVIRNSACMEPELRMENTTSANEVMNQERKCPFLGAGTRMLLLSPHVQHNSGTLKNVIS
jgi:hypothetical protein